MRCSRVGVLMLSTFHMQVTPETGFSDPDPNDVADGIWGHIQNEWLAVTASNISVDELVIDEQVNSPDIGANGSHVIDVAGTNPGTGGTVPDAMCALVNWQTNVSSRFARGWMHLPALTTASHVNGNALTQSYYDTCKQLADRMVGEIDFGSFFPARGQFVTFSRTRFQERLEPHFFTITGARVNPNAKWLRTRTTAP